MKIHLRYFLWVLVAVAYKPHASAQTHIIDSLQNDLKNSKDDSVTVLLFTALANEYYSYDTVKSRHYLEKGYLLAKKMNWDYALGDYYQIKAMNKQISADHDMAHLFFDSAIFYFKKTIKSKQPHGEVENAKLSMATSLGEKANILVKRGKSEEAIVVYLTTLETWKTSDNPQKNVAIGTYYTKISAIYYELKQYDKALFYDRLALSYYITQNNEEAVAWAYIFISNDFIALKQMDSSIHYMALTKPIIEQLNNHRLNVRYYNNLGQISSEKKDYRSAIRYYEKTIAEAKITNSIYQVLLHQKMIGICYVRLGEYATAREYLLTALPAAVAGNYVRDKIEILQELVTVEEKTNHISDAFTYLKKLVALRDSVNQENSKKAVAEIENKYQSAQKEKNILQLQNDKKIQALSIKQKSTLNYFLIGSVVVLLLIGFMGYRNFRHRRLLALQQDDLQQQRIRELEKDKQLVAVDSMLKGQEEERSRLAKDLHDGLGGMLSGVKFSLMNMKSNLIINHENVVVFERSLDMLDTSIRELRRVAHNMMPEALVKFGLDEALKDYCNNINSSNILHVQYQSFGMEHRLESNTEIIIYRIIQELFNNIFKHANASETLVQLLREQNRLSITVEDNGKGFDINDLEKSKGAGWANIRSRVEYLKGKLDLHSDNNKGTSVNIECPINLE